MKESGFAIFALFTVAFFLNRISEKLDNIAKLLGHVIDYQAQSASSLRSVAHDTDVLRERTPPLADEWDDLIAQYPDQP